SHARAAERQRTADDPDGPLNVTSPPPAGFTASPEALERRFATAMQFFSCEGQLLAYTPAEVRFHITSCNWVRAMERAGAPELIPFFCETDERFMDGHPTHRLVRPTAIGLGDDHCDFQFVPNARSTTASGG
ncbi:MAG: L-2-amino-thiazoline-4-carboxylic acid hydrolase, partial [Firmicutes bacterium]|nr:L-2-amino-thiazoline-4-carboxylic acid hydrolase [Bacillota bacterium]